MPGPLNKLIQNKSLTNLYYPLDLGSSRKGHYIMFTACVPQKSTYQSKGGTSVATAISPNSLMSGLEKGLNAVGSVASQGIAAFNTVNADFVAGVTAATDALSSVNGVTDGLSGAASKLSDTASLAGNFLNNPTAALSDAQNTLTSAVSGIGNVASSVSSLTQNIQNYFGGGSVLSDLRAGVGSLNSGWQNLLSAPTTRPVAYIQLYMPDTVNVNQQMQYKEYSMTEALGKLGIGAEAMSEATSLYDTIKNSNGVGDAMKNIAASAQPGAIESMAKLGEAAGAIKSGDDVARFALNKAGNAINPQMEVAFTQINFREFQFHFTFTPKSAREAKSVREIIKAFRFHGAPELEDPKKRTGRYFITPSTFIIDYIFEGGSNKNLHKFMPCVLTSIQVDYAQDVGWVAFEDGMPVKTHMVVQFREIEILTKDKVEGGH